MVYVVANQKGGVGMTTTAANIGELIAIDASGSLVVAAPAGPCSGVRGRFGPLLTDCSQRASRELRLADEAERLALGRGDGRPAPAARGLHINQQEVS